MLHVKSFIFFLIFLVSAFSVDAQNLSEIHSKIRSAVENRNYAAAIVELRNFEQSDPKNFALNNFDYLLARIAEKQTDFATATANYQSIVNRNSVLSEYALWHLSQIFRASGNLFLERIYLEKLSALAPESLLSNAAQTRITRSDFESKNFASVISRLTIDGKNLGEKQIGGGQNSADNFNRENAVLLGQAYLQSGKTDEARAIFTKLTENLPNPAQPDDFALAGAKALDEIAVGKENFGKIAPPLTDFQYLRRAQIYQFNRNFAFARLHYKALIEKFPASNLVSDALYQIGRGYAQERNFDEAIIWFERVQTEFPNDLVARDALNQAANAYARVNKPKEAIARYQKFIAQFPDADNIERAYLNIIDIYRDTGEISDALKWTAKTEEMFRGKLPEALALFAQAKIHLAQTDWTNALADLNQLQTSSDLGGTRVPGGTNQAEIAFLKGFTLENLNRYAEAIDVYLSIPDGRNEYYGGRATERLKALANDEKTQSFAAQKFETLREITKQNVSASNAKAIAQAAQAALRLLTDAEKTSEIAAGNMTQQEILLSVLRQTYAVLPDYQKVPNGKLLDFGRKEILKEKRGNSLANSHQNLADELLFLGLYDEAAPELENAQKLTPNPNSQSDLDYTLAVYYKRGDWANRAISFVEPRWRTVPADYQIELVPRDQIELLYPTPYADSLLKFAAPRRVDTRFILAIMRQESRFRPDVKSNAAARGLMQFISTTADKIAAELNRENFRQDELYNPPTAILFGSQYLSDLFKIFPNQPAAVAASYNGGEDNMARWFARAKSDNPDRDIPEIVFSQSKDYVYKVMASYRIYQTFYDENLRLK